MSAGGGLTGGERRPMMQAVELRLAVPLAIFAFTYFVFAVGNFPGLKLDRTGAALAGALLMVVTGSLSESQPLAAIDFHTILLLLGMMIIVANLRISGAFALVARWLLKRAHSGYGLLAMTMLTSGVLAAFFINDVVCPAPVGRSKKLKKRRVVPATSSPRGRRRAQDAVFSGAHAAKGSRGGERGAESNASGQKAPISSGPPPRR